MIPRVIKKAVDLYKLQKTDKLDGPLYELENGGHTFEIRVMKGLSPAVLSGTVAVRFIRADNVTVSFTGSLSENTVSVTLPQSCYTVPGHFGMVVFVSGSGTTDAVYACAGHVVRSTSDAVIDPEENIPSLEELLAQIEACENATTAANAAAASVPGLIADTFSTSVAYAAGAYVYHDGWLYRFTAGHQAGEWTGTDAVAVKMADDLGDLKSAIDKTYLAERTYNTDDGKIVVERGFINIDTGTGTGSTKRIRTSHVIVEHKSFMLVVDPNYMVAPYFYTRDEQGNYTYHGYITFQESGTVFTPKFEFNRIRLVWKRKDNADVTETDFENIRNSHKLLYTTDETLTVYGVAADAKTVGDRLQSEYTKAYSFEFGSIYKQDGTLGENVLRIRSQLIPITEDVLNNTLRFFCNVDTTNYIFKWMAFYNNGIFVKAVDTGYNPESTEVALDGTFNQFRISFAKPNDAEFTKTEVDSFSLSTVVELSLSANKKDIDKNEIFANPFSGLKYVALGDSLTYGFIPRNYEGYPGQLNSYAKLTAERLGMTFVNHGISGSYLAYRSGKNSMCRRYQDLPDDADLITVMGGTNDIRNGVQLGTMADRDDTTYYGALHTVLGGLYKKYMIDQGVEVGKTKHIVVLTPIKLLEQSAPEQGGTGELVGFEPWINAVKEVAAYYSLPCLDFYNLSGINPHLNETIQGTEEGYTGFYNPYITDGTHPTQEGAEMMADVLCGFLKGIM